MSRLIGYPRLFTVIIFFYLDISTKGILGRRAAVLEDVVDSDIGGNRNRM